MPIQIKSKGIEALEIFVLDPFDRRLENHTLLGKRSGHRSIKVTGDYRIIFRELADGTYEIVELIDVGTHSQLYK